MRGLVALGFARSERDDARTSGRSWRSATRSRIGVESVNTLVIRDGRVLGSSTDTAALGRPTRRRRAAVVGAGGAAAAWIAELAQRGTQVQVFSREGDWPPRVERRRPRRPRDAGQGRAALRAAAGSDGDRPRLSRRSGRDRARRGGARCRVRARRRPRRPRRAGRRVVRALDRAAGAGRGHARGSTLCRVTLGLDHGGGIARAGARRDPDRAARGARSSTAPRSTPTCTGASRATAAARASSSSRTRSRCSRAFATAARSERRSRSSSATATTRTGSGA